MRLYFTVRQIPELRDVPCKHIRTIFDHCLRAKWRQKRGILYLAALVFGILGGSLGAFVWPSHRAVVGAIVGSQIGIQIYIQFIYESARPEIRTYLQEHRKEIYDA
jgi:hypothetical protein